MVDVHHDRKIDAFFREFGVVGGAEEPVDVGDLVSFCLVLDDRQHFGLDFFGDNFAFRGDFGGHWEGEIPASGSDVGDDHSVFEVERFEKELRGFFFVSLGAIQPGRGFVAHVVRHLAAHVAVADPVGIVVVHLDVLRFLGLEDEKRSDQHHFSMLRDDCLDCVRL